MVDNYREGRNTDVPLFKFFIFYLFQGQERCCTALEQKETRLDHLDWSYLLIPQMVDDDAYNQPLQYRIWLMGHIIVL